jgi:hypothetical protein
MHTPNLNPNIPHDAPQVLRLEQIGVAIMPRLHCKPKPVGVITARIVQRWYKRRGEDGRGGYGYCLEAMFKGRKYGPTIICDDQDHAESAWLDWVENLVNPEDDPDHDWAPSFAYFWYKVGKGGTVKSWAGVKGSGDV